MIKYIKKQKNVDRYRNEAKKLQNKGRGVPRTSTVSNIELYM